MSARKSHRKAKPPRRRQGLSRGNLSLTSSGGPRTFPFTAIVGQEEMKLALTLNVIDPRIGGVLIMGHRGTGKSTAVRALAELLPEIEVVADCPYRCDPNEQTNLCPECAAKIASGQKLKMDLMRVRVVELPLGATEDRLCGTIDIERALKRGTKAFEPGLLARANRAFLYIDEVNLLEDHLVDILLDAAATGRNRVERESISVEHPARFVLVGSGNPEEGELRPQLQDRFGLYVEVATENDPQLRETVVEKRMSFDLDPDAFFASSESDQTRLRERISQAQLKLTAIQLDRDLLNRIAQLCSDLKVDGHRGELTIARAARALAAFEGRSGVEISDVRRVAAMALRHRLRRDPLEQNASTHQVSDALDRFLPSEAQSARSEVETRGRGNARTRNKTASAGAQESRNGAGEALTPEQDFGEVDHISKLDIDEGHSSNRRPVSTTSARRSKQRSKMALGRSESGRYQRAIKEKTSRVALDATLRAMAATQSSHLHSNTFDISADALRYKVFTRKDGPLFIFAIDTSGSMARHRIAIAKKALVNLLRKSYLNRDRVAIVGFSGSDAKLLLPPSRSILRARRILDGLTVGGGTPVSAALSCSLHVASRVSSKQRSSSVLLLFTDGGANVPLSKCDVPDRTAREQLIAKEIKILGADLRRTNVKIIIVATSHPFQGDHKADDLARNLKAQIVYASNPASRY